MANNKAKLWDIKRFPQDVARVVCAPLLPILRIKRLTPDGQPYREKLKGGAILAANHTAFFDPFVVACTFWYRRAFFLMAEVVMKTGIRAALLRGVGGIKVDRNKVDIEAIKQSVSVLKDGRLLIIFPQGGIADGEVETVKAGTALMALQAGVPIIPMYIKPRAHWYNRQQVVIGDTIHPRDYCTKKMPSTADIQAITDVLMNEMRRCAGETKEKQEYEHV